MTELVSRAEITDLVVSELRMDVTERVGKDWRRVSALVADQGNAEAAIPGFDFHFFELYLSGHHDVHFEGEFLNGDSWTGRYLPGHCNYLQNITEFKIQAEGAGQVQQIFLDTSIMSQCADAAFKGDADNVVCRGFNGVFDPYLKALAEALLEEARRPSIGTDLHADLIAQQMALSILRRQNADRILEPKKRVLSPEEVSTIISYLEEQIDDIGGMDTVAGLIGMDVYSFTRAFKETTGETPGQFLIQRRLLRAKDMLLHTNDTLADITYATGFSNQPHMTSTFTKHVGTSPGKWRKAVRA
ncbi:AraC family transcriptional regulator [uncultured Tateyamaria sp.]|uniref:helix-turn-helix domain-containing protein n=1 Tax=uncultured Tateyamaria sp. TaxID=455651 RepID=UPI00260FE1DF|nr:AraC family transcriptional regulator [uncultured Tateyamaria sp.]